MGTALAKRLALFHVYRTRNQKECDMGLLGGLDLPLIGGGNEDQQQTSDAGSESSGGGLLGGDLLGGDLLGGGLLGGGDGGGLSDPIGVGKYLDMGLDWMNEAGIDKYVGAAAGAGAAAFFTGGLGTEAGWQVGMEAGDGAGDIASGLDLFGGSEEAA
jgi:hypothetical protein